MKIQISLHSLFSLHHTLYKIYCFFVQIAQADQSAEMRSLIRAFTEQTCYFAEINVICFFSTCQKLKFFFRCMTHVFQYFQYVINNYLLKTEGHYYYTLKKKEKKIYISNYHQITHLTWFSVFIISLANIRPLPIRVAKVTKDFFICVWSLGCYAIQNVSLRKVWCVCVCVYTLARS